jgi:hypothetical protein
MQRFFEPSQQSALIGVDAAHVGGSNVRCDIGVRALASTTTDRSVLGCAARRAQLHQVVIRVRGDVGLKPRTQVVDLRSAFGRVLRPDVHPVLGVSDQHGVIDMTGWHQWVPPRRSGITDTLVENKFDVGDHRADCAYVTRARRRRFENDKDLGVADIASREL